MGNQVVALHISPLQELQKHYCLIDLAGEFLVLDRQQLARALSDPQYEDVAYYKKAEGILKMKRVLETLPVACKPKEVIDDFLISPSTLVYDKTAFSPDQQPLTTLNFWVGATTEPAKGDWRIISRYLYEIICDSNQETFHYLIRYLADMLQNPGEKPEVMPVLLGGQGTGKGMFFRLLRAIWSKTTLQVNDVDEVVGKFNASLERNFIVCMDEALFQGDRKALDRLKSIITEPTIRIEQKYQPSRSINSIHRFFATSNHEHFANVERDNRRFLFFKVSPTRQNDTAYFSALCAAIEDPDKIGAMVHSLLQVDLTNFDIRKKPDTAEHKKQKIQSLGGFERYWYEVLFTGDLYCGDVIDDVWTESKFVATNSLVSQYKVYDKQAGKYLPVQSRHVLETLKKICPSVATCRKLHNHRQQRGIELPHIDTARTEFEKYLGCKIEWEEA
jgi:hypothetical protein